MTKILLLFSILLMLFSSGCTNPSGGSVVAFNHTPLLDPPAAFQFTQVQASNGNVEIVWQVSTRADNYEFFIGTSSSEITTPVPSCSGNKESCQITGLDPDTIYYLDIKATNSAGSKKVTSIRSVLSVGSFNITSSSVGDKTITLSWDNSNNATSYNLVYGTSSGYYPSSVSNVTSPYILSGLNNGLRYYVRIVAVNSNSGSAASNNEINQQPVGPLSTPTGLLLTATPGQIALDWNDLSGATSYKVLRGTSSGSLTELASGITSSNYTDSTTTDGTTYFYALKAFNGFDSILSAEQSARSISAFNVTSTVAGPAPTQVTLNWPTTTGAATYEIWYGTNSGALNLILSNVTSPLVMSGLTGGVPYYFKVVAKNAIGNGTNQYSSNQLSATPIAAIAAPTGLIATASPSSVTLNWSAVAGATNYKVYRGLSAGSLSLLDASVATNSYVDPTVANGTTYYYAVRSFNGIDSADSSQVSIRPISSLALTGATVATFSSANLTWGSATGAATYDIRYGTSPGIYTNTSLNRSSPFLLSGLSASTTYFIAVRANNSVGTGTSILSNEMSLTTTSQFPTVSILSSPSIDNSNKTAYTVSGACSENTRTVTVSIGGIVVTPTCSSLSWTSGAVDVTAASDSLTLTITANHSNSAGNAATQASTTVIKDTSNPNVAITSYPRINDSNKTAYTVSGTCSENTITVAVNIGGVAATPTCTSLTWTTGPLNVSGVADSATVLITANHTDSIGNSAVQASTTVVKDTAIPTVALTSAEPATTSGASWVVRATFNEAVTGMAITDFVVGNGSASGFTAVSTTLYDITVTPAGAGLVTVNLASNSAADAAGNGNTAATQLSRTHVTPAVLTFAVTSTHDFGLVNVGGSAEVTIILNKSGMANATSITEIGLAAPFTFKGGAYPGTGGTCTTTISAACSIVLLYTPTGASVSNDAVQIQYNNGAISQSVSRNLTGTGVVIVPTHTSISGPTGIMINQCIPYTINTVTSAGVNGNVSANQTINLVVNNGTGTFYSNNTCATTATNTIITAGTSSKIVYFKSTTTAQSLTLVFNPTSLVSSTHNVTTASTPVAISFTTPVEMQTNDCNPIVVNLVDANGTAVGKSAAVQLNLAQNGAATFYSDSNCLGVTTSLTYTAYVTTKTVYVKDATQQTVNINVTDNAALLTAKNANISFVNALVWWDNNYLKRIPIILNNKDQATAFTDLPVMIKLNASRISYSDILAGGADIRFTLDDHTTALKYEIESWNSSGDSFIWVKIPSMAASADKIIYMYYNNSSAVDGQDATNTWTGFSGVWNMKKSGVNYIDSTGSGKTGVAQGTVTDLTGPSANAISVNGASSLDVSYNLAQIIGKTSTLSFWMKTAQVGSNTVWQAPGITGVEQSGGGNDIFFGWISATGTIRISTGNGANATSNFIVNDNSWRHITMSRNETTGAVKFYVNGVLNGSGTSETGAKTTPFSQFGAIGDTGGPPQYFNGSMDGIRLKAVVETDARIKAEYKFGTESNVTYGSVENF